MYTLTSNHLNLYSKCSMSKVAVAELSIVERRLFYPARSCLHWRSLSPACKSEVDDNELDCCLSANEAFQIAAAMDQLSQVSPLFQEKLPSCWVCQRWNWKCGIPHEAQNQEPVQIAWRSKCHITSLTCLASPRWETMDAEIKVGSGSPAGRIRFPLSKSLK